MVPAVSPLRVLIAEPHALARRALTELLRDDGHDVRDAADGGAALDVARAQQPDIVIIEIELPDTDGCDVVRKLGAVAPACAVIVVSACANRHVRACALAAGAREYIIKPMDFANLTALFPANRHRV